MDHSSKRMGFVSRHKTNPERAKPTETIRFRGAACSRMHAFDPVFLNANRSTLRSTPNVVLCCAVLC
jgi:hypothetical protein